MTRRPEGRSIVELARKRLTELARPRPARTMTAGFRTLADTITEEIPFKAETRTSGVRTTAGGLILKGAVDAIAGDLDGAMPAELLAATDRSPTRARRRWRLPATAGCSA